MRHGGHLGRLAHLLSPHLDAAENSLFCKPLQPQHLEDTHQGDVEQLVDLVHPNGVLQQTPAGWGTAAGVLPASHHLPLPSDLHF